MWRQRLNQLLKNKGANYCQVEMKKVQVQMSNKCHAVLKDYANAWDMTMSEVMYEAIRSFIHKDSEYFEHISSLLAFRGISIDKRTSKQCYGHLCFACKHRTACGTGLYEGSWEMNNDAKKYIALHPPKSSSSLWHQPKELVLKDTTYLSSKYKSTENWLFLPT